MRVNVKSTQHNGDAIELSGVGDTLLFTSDEKVGGDNVAFIYLKPSDVEKLVVASLTWLNEQDPSITFTLTKSTKTFTSKVVQVPVTEHEGLV